MAWQNDTDPVCNTLHCQPGPLPQNSHSYQSILSSPQGPSPRLRFLDPDIGKGRQIKELIVVILKFGEIEKEIGC